MDVEHVFLAWHERARTGDVEGLLELYAQDATFESPLVPVLTDGELEVCRGHAELRRFFEEGIRRRPNELVRWYRTGDYLTNGRLLVWEYPREAPDGNQIDICEVWGWFGVAQLTGSRRALEALPRVAG